MKNNNEFLKVALLALVISYGSHAFVQSEPNPFEWSEPSRAFMLICAGAGVFYRYMIKSLKED